MKVLQSIHKQKLDLVNNLERLGYRVFISSESELEPELMRYKMNLHPHEILDVINYASVFIGEGATMAMEAAILGVPSIFVSTIQLGYISELCGFHIIEQVTGDKINERLESLISAFGNREHLLQKRADFLKNKIEVSDYLTDFIINYSKVKKGNI